MAKPLILILAGGTGGHVYPALSVALALRQRGADLLWLGLENKIEARVARQNNIGFVSLRSTGIRGKHILSKATGCCRMLFDCVRLFFWLGKYKPEGAAGFGGYSSVAAGIACWLRQVPLLVHEQNAIAGSANKVLARIAQTVCLGYQGSLPTSGRTYFTGNPVREEFTHFRPQKRNGPLRVLVLGGSLGARSINDAIAAAIAMIDLPYGLSVVHQCGQEHLDATRSAYQSVTHKTDFTLNLQPFLDPVIDYYSMTDLVICRAGAMTLAELAVCRLPALLIPFPYAVDDHQTANARVLAGTRGAWMLTDSEDINSTVGQWLQYWCSMSPEQARTEIRLVGSRLHAVAKPDATHRIAQLLLEGLR